MSHEVAQLGILERENAAIHAKRWHQQPTFSHLQRWHAHLSGGCPAGAAFLPAEIVIISYIIMIVTCISAKRQEVRFAAKTWQPKIRSSFMEEN
jgi:hypothetical protein